MDEEINSIINRFISQWCGVNVAHLLDTDENAGQVLRDSVRQYGEDTSREARMEVVRRVREAWIKDSWARKESDGSMDEVFDTIERENQPKPRS